MFWERKPASCAQFAEWARGGVRVRRVRRRRRRGGGGMVGRGWGGEGRGDEGRGGMVLVG